ncbi:MAG TPA: SRPBCC family protein [Bryobacteraceae bacterium]|jgi:hypothetical protein
MRLQSKIVIERPPEQVWKFLGDIGNVAKWDRGVSSTTLTSAGPVAAGSSFDTLAHGSNPEKGRMSYRIAETGSDRCVIDLTSSGGNARYFSSASWIFEVEPGPPEYCSLTCAAVFGLRARYFFLAPMLYFMKRGIAKDLRNLKRVIEQNG